MEPGQFDWFEYIVFGAVLFISTMIGVFFCCSKGGQHTIAEYYLGNKQMSIFPVAMSLIASFISGITLLGQPSEVYSHGALIIFASFSEIIMLIINVTVYLPVFYNLQIISLYEYLEMRFDSRVRLLASALFTVGWILYMPIVIYGPALAFNQVSGLNLHVVSLTVCLVCIFYTTVGGLKAVLWADALQAICMAFAFLVVLIAGLSKVGGMGNVISAAWEGQRLDVFKMDPDPTVRLTFWSATVGWLFLWMSRLTSPVTVQRYLALPTLRAANISMVFLMVGVCTFFLLSVTMGLVIHANYRYCDPLSANMIKRPDQILPYFVVDVAGHLKGIPGLFLAGIVCAALSTMSTGMNTLSGTIYEDFIEPAMGKKSERTASNIMKVLSILIGILCTALVSIVEKLGNIIDMGASLGSVTGGAALGIFSMGVLIPQVNAKGAFYGGIASSTIMLWIMVGHELAPKCDAILPISIDGCAEFNITNVPPIANVTCPEVSRTFQMGFPLHALTPFYYGLLGLTICVVVGLAVSYGTGFNDPDTVNPDLLSPLIRKTKSKGKTTYTAVPLQQSKGMEKHIIPDKEKLPRCAPPAV